MALNAQKMRELIFFGLLTAMKLPLFALLYMLYRADQSGEGGSDDGGSRRRPRPFAPPGGPPLYFKRLFGEKQLPVTRQYSRSRTPAGDSLGTPRGRSPRDETRRAEHCSPGMFLP